MVGAALSLAGRDLRLALRQRSDAGTVVLFFVLIASLFPLAIGPAPNLLLRRESLEFCKLCRGCRFACCCREP